MTFLPSIIRQEFPGLRIYHSSFFNRLEYNCKGGDIEKSGMNNTIHSKIIILSQFWRLGQINVLPVRFQRLLVGFDFNIRPLLTDFH